MNLAIKWIWEDDRYGTFPYDDGNGRISRAIDDYVLSTDSKETNMSLKQRYDATVENITL